MLGAALGGPRGFSATLQSPADELSELAVVDLDSGARVYRSLLRQDSPWNSSA